MFGLLYTLDLELLKYNTEIQYFKEVENMETPHGGTFQREGMRFTYQHKALFIVNYIPV